MTAALLGALAVPALAGAALLVLGRHADRAAGGVGVAVAAVVLALVLLAPGAVATEPFVPRGPLALGVDGLAALVLVLVAAVSLVVLVQAAALRHGARFTGLMLLFVAAVVLTVCATTLPALLAGWEAMGATSGLLVAQHLADREAVAAGLTAFVTTRTADLGLYLAVGAAAAGGGGLALADLSSAPPGWRDAIAAGIVVAALGKAAQPPFSFWLARAMAGPSTVSALLHSAAMVAMGGYLLLRVEPLLAATGWAGPAVAWIGAASAVLLGVVALAQTDLKRLLAASTAAQLGFVLLAAGIGAIAGGTAQLLAHAVTKAALFLVAGAWLAVRGQRRIADLAGAGRRDRATGVVATVAAASLAGLPPLSVWAAKDLLLAAAGPALLVVGLLGAAAAAAYSGRIVRTVWRADPGSAEPRRDGDPAIPVRLVAPGAVLAGAAVLLGAVALPAVDRAFATAVGQPDAADPSPLLVGASAVVAAGGFALGALRDLPRPALAERWFGMEAAARLLVVRPVLRLAGAASRADGSLEGAVLRAGAGVLPSGATTADDHATAFGRSGGGVLALARVAERFDRAGPDGLLRGVGAVAGAAGRAARRLQTGRLHQYYLLAAGGAVVLVLIALVVR